jgi:hypothetical protein
MAIIDHVAGYTHPPRKPVSTQLKTWIAGSMRVSSTSSFIRLNKLRILLESICHPDKKWRAENSRQTSAFISRTKGKGSFR